MTDSLTPGKKFTFDVLLEERVRKTIKIDADTPEEAMQLAIKQSAKPKSMLVNLSPTWIEESKRCVEMGELSMQLIGACSRCSVPLLDGATKDWHKDRPYPYASDPENNYLLVCYSCLQPPLLQLAECAAHDDDETL